MPTPRRPVTVAVAGTHSTGKSTFLARLSRELIGRSLRVATVDDLGTAAQALGLPILTRHTYESTLWIIARGISDELAARADADVVLIDRPAPDALGYYHAALAYREENGDPAQLAELNQVVTWHTRRAYDLIFLTRLDPDLPLGIDKPRDTDSRFRALADHQVRAVFAQLAVATDDLTPGTQDTALHRATAYVTARLAAMPMT